MSLTPLAQTLRAGIAGVVKVDEPLSRHTTYRIGGPADLLIECDSIADLTTATTLLAEHEVEYRVLGKGSNILASDEGYRGAVIILGRGFKRHTRDGSRLRSGAGVILAALVQEAFRHGLTGLEFAVGIPGTVGGALAMNAGSRDDWIERVVESVTVFRPGEGLASYGGSEVRWGYRGSDLVERGIIVETSLKLEEGDEARIRRVMEASLRRRKQSQPLGVPSAGSVFVNPPGDSAGRLIEACGLKGAVAGGARVSEVHANFIVTEHGATAADVVALIRRIRSAVKESYGIELRPEIAFLGPFGEA